MLLPVPSLKLLLTAVTAVVLSLPLLAQAQVDATPLPGDPKIVEFRYDPNNSFRIFTRPLAATHIQLDEDERVKLLALGDTVGWITEYRLNNIFVKPKYPNTSSPATLITNKRTYQLLFRSTDTAGRWYQRVTFEDPSVILVEDKQADRAALAATPSVAPDTYRKGNDVQIQEPANGDLNFDYEISGDDKLSPTAVYDNGVSTFIQLRNGQDVPAVFRLVGGDIELVEFIVKGNAIIVPRVLDAGMLKLGKTELRFYNKRKVKKNFFGGYRFEGNQK